MKVDFEICESILNRVPTDIDAQVQVRSTRKALTRFANSFIHQNVEEDSVAVSLDIEREGRTARTSTTSIESDSIDRLVASALSAAAENPIDEEWPGFSRGASIEEVDHHDAATAAATPDERAAIVADFISADFDLRAAGYCETTEETVTVLNRNGLEYQGSATSAVLDGIHQTADSAGKAHRASRALGDLDGSAVGGEAAEIARRASDPRDVEPGEYQVVLRPNCAATIAVFVGLYAFGGKAASEGRTQIELGRRQFDQRLSMRDDVYDNRAVGLPIDWEGNPKSRVDLIDSGISSGFVHDRRTAARMGVLSTGHDWEFSQWFGPAPTNIFIEGGDRSEAEMVSSVERGLLVTEFNYCRILDPTTLVVTGLTRNGTFLIEDGQVTSPVRNLRFTQSFLQAWSEGGVLAVGNDARLADSEYGPRAVHAPTMHLARWNFTGGSKG